jgi:hypothetical protein
MKHPDTRLWLLAYSLNGAPPQLWLPNNGPLPEAFRVADRIIAHNIEFERALWRHILTPRYGFPPLPPRENWFCTLSATRMCALPGALGNVAHILNLPYRKANKEIMARMSKPRKPYKGEDWANVYWNDNPADLAILGKYCIGDVLCEMALYQWILHHWDMSRSSFESSTNPTRTSASPSISKPLDNVLY